MKKILSMVLILLLLAWPILASAENDYSFQYLPDISVSEDTPAVVIDAMLMVDLQWAAVYNMEEIDIFVSVPHDAQNIVSVILTDGIRMVYGNASQIGYGTLYVRFHTEQIRYFVTKHAYMIFLATNQ